MLDRFNSFICQNSTGKMTLEWLAVHSNYEKLSSVSMFQLEVMYSPSDDVFYAVWLLILQRQSAPIP